MLSRLFHKKIRSNSPHIPEDTSLWPTNWSDIEYKEYPRFPFFPLSTRILKLGDLETLLKNRHSSDLFNNLQSTTQMELSTLLHYSAGLNTARVEDEKNFHRYYPSGGGRYPLEVYLGIQNVEGIEPGLYHYNVNKHGLELMLYGLDNVKKLNDSIKFTNKSFAVSFIISAVQTRNAIKYGDSGYDMFLVEAGHMSQTLHLVAEALGLQYCPIFSYNSENIHTILDAREDELILYLTLLGR